MCFYLHFSRVIDHITNLIYWLILENKAFLNYKITFQFQLPNVEQAVPICLTGIQCIHIHSTSIRNIDIGCVTIFFMTFFPKLSVSSIKFAVSVFKFSEAGLKLSEAGLKLSEAGLKLSEAGLKLSEAGLKLSEAGLKLSEDGIKLCVSRLLSTGSKV